MLQQDTKHYQLLEEQYAMRFAIFNYFLVSIRYGTWTKECGSLNLRRQEEVLVVITTNKTEKQLHYKKFKFSLSLINLKLVINHGEK